MAYSLRELTSGYRAKLFINDRVDVALAVYADGVHLGGESIPAFAARKAAGEAMLIGVSAHSIEEAKKAVEEGADFVTEHFHGPERGLVHEWGNLYGRCFPRSPYRPDLEDGGYCRLQ